MLTVATFFQTAMAFRLDETSQQTSPLKLIFKCLLHISHYVSEVSYWTIVKRYFEFREDSVVASCSV
jgi:hypothetical protein